MSQPLRRILAVLGLFLLSMVACGPVAAPVPTPDLESTVEAIVEEKMANLLVDSAAPVLSSDGAVSILRNYLQICIDKWDTDENTRWWRDLATGANTDITWSARYLGTDTVGFHHIERWAVIGAGLEGKVGAGLVPVPGPWEVTAGERVAKPLDGPAQKAELEFERPIPSGHCRG